MKTQRFLVSLLIGLVVSVLPVFSADEGKVESIDNQIRQLGFGAGVAAIHISGDGEVDNASVDAGGVLRVDRKSATRVGGVLEAHYLFNDQRYSKSTKSRTQLKALTALGDAPDGAVTVGSVASDVAYGPMVTVELGENTIRTLGLGFMVSMRRFDVTRDSTGKYVTIKPRGVAFNLGLSVLLEPNVKDLADGLVADQALPSGSEVRFKEESRVGYALVFSAGF